MKIEVTLEPGDQIADGQKPTNHEFVGNPEATMMVNGLVQHLTVELDSFNSKSFKISLGNRPVARLLFHPNGFQVNRYPSLQEDRLYNAITVSVDSESTVGLL